VLKAAVSLPQSSARLKADGERQELVDSVGNDDHTVVPLSVGLLRDHHLAIGWGGGTQCGDTAKVSQCGRLILWRRLAGKLWVAPRLCRARDAQFAPGSILKFSSGSAEEAVELSPWACGSTWLAATDYQPGLP
jgi:hypothetical protein